MQIQIHTHNLNLGQHLQDYVEKKLNKLDKYLPNIAEVHVDLTQENSHRGGSERSTAQLTIRTERGTILRAEDKKQSDINSAIDMAVDKMYRQISRYKGKRSRRDGERFEVLEPELAAAEAVPVGLEINDDEDYVEIIRRKQIEMIPMSEEEAMDQMDLLGHDFFMFFNAVTGKVNVLYRREGGGYGLLQPYLS